MNRQPNYFIIGLFITAGFVILAAGLIAFGAGQMFRPRIYMETYVNGTVQGVDVGTLVKFRGVTIGRVSAINFAFNEYGQPNEVDKNNFVIILMEIDREMFPGMFSENLTPLIEKNVKQGMRARIEPLGITGMNYIEINYLKDPSQFPQLAFNWKPYYYYIPSAPGQLTNILDSVNNMMREVEQLNIGDLSENLSEIMSKLNQALSDAQIEKLSSGLQALIGDVQSALKDANLGEVSADARKLMAGLDQSNKDLQKVLKNIEPTTQMNPEEVRAIVKN
ncbi:MAG TPA: MlaD family protein, partial [Terrimicrobiaceae bacterium]|nr:MlaD family protein [Terrimicrobiaceae bacterium]